MYKYGIFTSTEETFTYWKAHFWINKSHKIIHKHFWKRTKKQLRLSSHFQLASPTERTQQGELQRHGREYIYIYINISFSSLISTQQSDKCLVQWLNRSSYTTVLKQLAFPAAIKSNNRGRCIKLITQSIFHILHTSQVTKMQHYSIKNLLWWTIHLGWNYHWTIYHKLSHHVCIQKGKVS